METYASELKLEKGIHTLSVGFRDRDGTLGGRPHHGPVVGAGNQSLAALRGELRLASSKGARQLHEPKTLLLLLSMILLLLFLLLLLLLLLLLSLLLLLLLREMKVSASASPPLLCTTTTLPRSRFDLSTGLLELRRFGPFMETYNSSSFAVPELPSEASMRFRWAW